MNSLVNQIAWNQAQAGSPQDRFITLFVYGTLKRGYANHERFCGDALHVETAVTQGQLYQLSAGYPALMIPTELVLIRGSADPLVDMAKQKRFAAEQDTIWPPLSPEKWGPVHGELISLPDPARTLPPIDRLEGFHPGRDPYYQRVLIPVWAAGRSTAAWTYIMPGCSSHQRLRAGAWPPSDR